MSSGRPFPDRVARRHGPSPLHRHAQIATHPLPASSKPDISTLRSRSGHFYFALPEQRLSRAPMKFHANLRSTHQGRFSARFGHSQQPAAPPSRAAETSRARSESHDASAMGFPVGGRLPGCRRAPASVGFPAASPQEHHGAEQDRQNSADQAQSGRIHR